GGSPLIRVHVEAAAALVGRGHGDGGAADLDQQEVEDLAGGDQLGGVAGRAAALGVRPADRVAVEGAAAADGFQRGAAAAGGVGGHRPDLGEVALVHVGVAHEGGHDAVR